MQDYYDLLHNTIGLVILIYISVSTDKMIINRKNIKIKIDQLDTEIKSLENKINEMSWLRMKYQQFYKKSLIPKADH